MSVTTEITRLQKAKADIKEEIENKGVFVGDGLVDTYAEKIQDVYDAGKQVEYDTFWDSCQFYGARTSYQYGFAGKCWNDTTFRPKYNITPSRNASHMLYFCEITDLEKILNDCGVIIDFTNVTTASYVFATSYYTVIPEIDVSMVNLTLSYWFDSDTSLEIIRKIKVSEGTKYPYTFKSCPKLWYIRFEGYISDNISFADSYLLDHDSLMNISEHLYDFSGTGTTKTLTLHGTAKSKLSDAEKAAISQKGWTIA